VQILIINKKNRAWTFGISLVVCAFMVGMIGCKADPPLSDIEVSNECGAAIDVYMDGIYQFFLEYGFIKTVEDVEWGTYTFEARRNPTGEFVTSEDLSVRMNEILKWRVWSSADIKITNNYGEKLRIFGDNVYVGELEDQTSSIMEHVPYGDRKLEAKLSDDTVVASTTISVLENIIYKWTVEK
jgi:hypothetical protein